MKKISWFLVAAALVAAAPSACSSDKKSNDGAGGSGGEGGAGVTTGNGTNTTGTGTTGNGTTGVGGGATGTTSAVGPTTGAGGADCSGVFSGDCDTCAEASCCAETAACAADADCYGCLSGDTDPSVCDASAAFQALVACIQGSCADPCIPSSQCNPVTAEGCNVAGGATCDLEQSGVFVCFDPPNDAVLCGGCDNQNGPFCGAGLSCFNGKCTHYCCTDADCGTGTCNLGQPVDGVGTCVDAADNTQPACDSPATPPSAGSCYTGKIAAP